MQNTNLFELFYSRIEELRIERGYNKKYVCEQIGISEQTYQNWINGHTNSYDNNRKPTKPTLESVIKLSSLYDKSIDYLMGYTDFTSIENEEISKIIGLSDTAINQLKKIHTNKSDTNNNIMYALNMLLSNPPFGLGVLQWMGVYLNPSEMKGYISDGNRIPFTEQKQDRLIHHDLFVYDTDDNMVMIDIDVIRNAIADKIRYSLNAIDTKEG